jgi:hypothetical protein
MRRLLLLSLILLSACYFEPEGDFFNEIPERDYSALSIDLNAASDTIYLSIITRFEYNTKTADFTVVGVIAEVGTREVYRGQGGGEGVFFLDPNQFATGTYTLTLSVIVQSGTGSLADKLNAEIVQVWREFVLIMDAEQPQQVTITTLDTTKGNIIVNWNSYKKWNFQSYTLVKEYSRDNYYYETTDYVTIDSHNDTSWVDSNFVGGYVRYRIDITAAGKTTRSDVASYSWLPESSFTVDNAKVNFNWEPPLFYANVKETILYSPYPPYINFEAVSSSLTSYSIDTPLELGEIYGIILRYESNNPNQSLQFQLKAFIGKQYFFPHSQPTLFHPTNKLYYGYTALNGGVNSIMDQDLNFNSMVYWNPAYYVRKISLNGQFFISLEVIGNGFAFYDTNPESLQLSNQYQLDGYINYDLSVSNNGLIAFSSFKGTFVLDWLNKNMIFSTTIVGEQVQISPSGKYLMIGKNIFKNQSGTFQFHGSVTIDFLTRAVFNEADELIVSYYDGTLKLWDITNFSLVATVQTPISNAWSINYDPVSKRVLITDFRAHYLINFQTGSVNKIVSDNYNVTLLNGKLFAPLKGQLETFVAIDYNYFE